jgi:hypothetical protein
MNPPFFQTRAKFLKANRERFAGWGEANNHRITGAGLDEFHDLFVSMCSYYQRLSWISEKRPIWYRRAQLSNDTCDRWLGQTPYGKMFSKFRVEEK